MSQLIERALALAAQRHAGILRTGTDTPYIVHLVMVGMLLQRHGFSDEVVAAGILHDIIEDTETSAEELERLFGSEVTTIVQTVSHRGDAREIWRAAREEYIDQVAGGSEGAKAVSLADKIHNIHSMQQLFERYGAKAQDLFNWDWDDRLWVYRELLRRVRESWDHPLVAEYQQSVAIMEAIALKHRG